MNLYQKERKGEQFPWLRRSIRDGEAKASQKGCRFGEISDPSLDHAFPLSHPRTPPPGIEKRREEMGGEKLSSA